MAERNYNTPGNSLNVRPAVSSTSQQTDGAPKVNKVIKGTATLKKQTKGEKIAEASKSAFKNVMANTVAPSIKDLILNAIWNGLSMIFFPDGSHRPAGYGYGTPASKVSYFSGGYNNYGGYYGQKQQPKAFNVSEPAFRNPLMGSIQDANAVVDAMRNVIREYGFATWSTLYDLCGMDSANWQGTTKYGWTSIESTTISRVQTADGQMAYELRMPKASPIDDTPF